MQIENIVSDSDAVRIEAALCDANFPWFYRPSSVYGLEGPDTPDHQWVHAFYVQGQVASDYYDLIIPVLRGFESATGHQVLNLYKVKANLTTPMRLTDCEMDQLKHTDHEGRPRNYASIVYYVNDSDGDTLVYDDLGTVIERVTPRRGSAVWFPSYQLHRPGQPQLHKTRVVLNFVVEIK